MSTWRFAHVLMTMAFGAGLGGCFNPPAGSVLFACDAETAPTCPAGYSCEADDCCHRKGSDIEAELGSCRIGGGMSASDTATAPASTTSTTSTASTDTDNTTSTTSTATDTTATSGSVTTSTASSGAGTSGSSGGDTGSSDAGTTT